MTRTTSASTATSQTGEFHLTGRHVLLGFVAFFGLIVAVNVTMATFAGGTWPGLVVANSYVESQRFNDRLAEARRQNARGLELDMRYGGGRLTLALSDAKGRPADILAGTVRIGRPVTTAEDRLFDLPHARGGDATIDADLAPGLWIAKVTLVTDDGQTWRRETRLFVKDPAK